MEGSRPPRGVVQKKLVTGEDFEREKNWQMNAKQKEMEEINKKKELRQKIVAEYKEFKRIKKAGKEKEDKKELWSRLQKLNENFGKIKEHKKNNKKKKVCL